MPRSHNELVLYDRTRKRLWEALAGQLPATVDLEGTLTAYAYWVCTTVSKRGVDWEELLREYTGIALHRAADDSEAERREVALLRRELAQVRGPVLDVGAGWGRLAPFYEALGLRAVYLEPAALGTQLMRRRDLNQVVCGMGEALPLANETFLTTVIGWVLHHDSSDVDAVGILGQAARVTAPGGRLLSVEPLSESFAQEKWVALLTKAGFVVDGVERFFEAKTSRGKTECHALVVGTRCPS